MSNITTDFVTTAKKILSSLREVLTTLHLLKEDVKIIKDNLQSERDKNTSTQQETEANKNHANGVSGRSEGADMNETNGETEKYENETGHYFTDLKNRFFKEIKKPKFVIEVLMFSVVVIYTFETGCQVRATLIVMRSDQRAWIAPVYLRNEQIINKGDPIFRIVQFPNTGKTPAIAVEAMFRTVVVKTDERPLFDYPPERSSISHSNAIWAMPEPMHVKVGLFNDPSDGPARPRDLDEALQRGGGTNELMIMTYGRITYDDIYGTSHWVQVCNWMRPTGDRPVFSTVASRACADYNDVDRK